MSGLLAAALGVLGGLALLWRTLRARLGPLTAAGTLAVLLLATFLLDIVVRGLLAPAFAFLFASFAVALSGEASLPRWPRALATGLLAGTATGVHWGNAGLLLLAAEGEGAIGPKTTAKKWLCAAAGFALGVAPWWLLRTASSPHLGWPDPLAVLFGSRQGLLYLTPVLWLALTGLVLALLRHPSARPCALAGAGLLLLQAFCRDPAGGHCPREVLAPLLGVLAPGLGLALRELTLRVRASAQGTLGVAAALAVAWNLLFMQQYASGMIPRDLPVSFTRVAENNAALLSRAVGTPLAWPANWIFAWRHQLKVDRYDLAAGKRLPGTLASGLEIDIGALPIDQALLAEGWSVRHPCGGEVCRAVEGQARLLLPLPSASTRLELRVRASGQGDLSAALGTQWSDPVPLSPTPADLVFVLPDARRGLNQVSLRTAPAGQALVDRLTVRELPAP